MVLRVLVEAQELVVQQVLMDLAEVQVVVVLAGRPVLMVPVEVQVVLAVQELVVVMGLVVLVVTVLTGEGCGLRPLLTLLMT